MEEVYWSADHHMGHNGVIQFASRPWRDRDAMDIDLINCWNSVVPLDGLVMYVGDFSFRGTEETLAILSELHGEIHLIRGNHDKNMHASVIERFASITEYSEIKIQVPKGHQRVVACHYAFRSWNGMYNGSWNLHGHSHGKMEPLYNQLDIGIDNAYKLLGNYRPFSMSEIQTYMDAQPTPEVEGELEDPL